ncbi:MAG: response regulator, partial [Microvirga sp.]
RPAEVPAGEHVLIEVLDTGEGIPPEIMEKIFEPFFTTKEIGKGTGLGLSTVFGIVKQSGGTLDVQSTVGEGTAFRIFLPRHIPEAEPAIDETVPAIEPPPRPATSAKIAKERLSETLQKPAPIAPPATPAVPDTTGQATILLVEDEDPVRAVNSRALMARGYTVLPAASGPEALRLMEEHDYAVDLVVSDVVMPEMDGPTLLRELRTHRPDLKVIFVSGYAEDVFRKNLHEGESFDYLAKPFSLKQLVETVKTTLAG